jgi:steroid delta-isomerase-like uncharacterized protein
MNTAATDALLNTFAAAWSRQDVDAILALFDEDLQFEDIPLGFEARSKDELRQVLETTFAGVPDFTMKILERHIGEGVVTTKWTQSGTMTAHAQGLDLDAHPYAVTTTSIIKLSPEGRITAVSDNWNTGVLFQ